MLQNEEKVIIERIVNHLILRTNTLNEIGLYTGKMGVVLFFAHYANIFKKEIYDDYAWHVLNDIISDMNIYQPWTMENGVLGIMWGVEYLFQSNLLDGNSDDVLCDLDQRILELDFENLSDKTFDTGLSGIINYLYYRSKTSSLEMYKSNRFSPLFHKYDVYTPLEILRNIYKKKPNIDNFIDCNLGIREGIAGYGLHLMHIV